MNTEIKIAVVEDELLIAKKINHILAEFGYAICKPASNYADALTMIAEEKPDMVLIDINLKEVKDGIDIAQQINEKEKLPFIFLTANSDATTIERAKLVNPYAYLVKPFTKEELHASIEIAFNNFTKYTARTLYTPQLTGREKTFLFIKEGYRFIKIDFSEIIYVESRLNYLLIHSFPKKEIMVRSTLSDFLEQLPADKFCRVHRSYAVHTDLVENIEPTEITVGGYKVPSGNAYRTTLFEKLGIKE